MDFEDEDRRKPSAESQAKGSTSVLATTRILFIQNQEQHFGHHYDCDIDKKEHVHMHYPGIGSSRVKSQTLDCSTLALKHYNKEKGKSYSIDIQQPMDSNAFHLEFPSPSKWYVHVNFWALSNSGTRMLFFAELQGEHGPDVVGQVTLIGHNEDELKAASAENICPFCTGILHPRSEKFIGHELALQ